MAKRFCLRCGTWLHMHFNAENIFIANTNSKKYFETWCAKHGIISREGVTQKSYCSNQLVRNNYRKPCVFKKKQMNHKKSVPGKRGLLLPSKRIGVEIKMGKCIKKTFLFKHFWYGSVCSKSTDNFSAHFANREHSQFGTLL